MTPEKLIKIMDNAYEIGIESGQIKMANFVLEKIIEGVAQVELAHMIHDVSLQAKEQGDLLIAQGREILP